MVLVDSSVWIDYFNGRLNGSTEALDRLLSEVPLVVGDLVLMEVLQGFRDDRAYRTARSLLLSLEVRELSSVPLALRAAEHFRRLRRRGVTVRKSVDSLIATWCIEERIPLLHNDRDFDPWEEHLGLEVIPVR